MNNTIIFSKHRIELLNLIDIIIPETDISHIIYPSNRKSKPIMEVKSKIDYYAIKEIYLPYRKDKKKVNEFVKEIRLEDPTLFISFFLDSLKILVIKEEITFYAFSNLSLF